MAVWVFPGQGSQRPDMAAGLAAAPALLREAQDVLGVDLTGACLPGAGAGPDAGPGARPDTGPAGPGTRLVGPGAVPDTGPAGPGVGPHAGPAGPVAGPDTGPVGPGVGPDTGPAGPGAGPVTGLGAAEDPQLVQPALFLVGVAAATALLRHEPPPDAVIGHSFGEFAALTAAGALPFASGLRLAALRARAMARRADARTGMVAVLGLAGSEVRAACEEVAADGGFVRISNINSPSQTVIAGTMAATEAAGRLCRARGAFRIRPLRVPYAAHTPLMGPAAAELRSALADIDLRAPAAKLYSCLTGEATADPDRIRELLVLGMTRPVDFHAAVRAAAHDGHRAFVELGPGSPARLLGLVQETLSAEVPFVELRVVSNDDEARTPRPFKPGRSKPHPTRQAVDDVR